MKPKILVVVANYYEKVSLKLSFFTKGILDKKTQLFLHLRYKISCFAHQPETSLV